eukprot:gene127-4373_t
MNDYITRITLNNKINEEVNTISILIIDINKKVEEITKTYKNIKKSSIDFSFLFEPKNKLQSAFFIEKNSESPFKTKAQLQQLNCDIGEVSKMITNTIYMILAHVNFKKNAINKKILTYFSKNFGFDKMNLIHDPEGDSKDLSDLEELVEGNDNIFKGLTISSVGRLPIEKDVLSQIIENNGGEWESKITKDVNLVVSSEKYKDLKDYALAVQLNNPIVTDFIYHYLSGGYSEGDIMEEISEDDLEKDVNFSYKSSVNEQWDKKKEILGIMDDEISNTKLYKLDYQSECEK